MLSVGINRTRNHPSILPPELVKSNASVHAEIAALSSLLHQGLNLKHATLYVARVSRTGNLALSKPCRSCAYAIELAGIRKVVWSV